MISPAKAIAPESEAPANVVPLPLDIVRRPPQGELPPEPSRLRRALPILVLMVLVATGGAAAYRYAPFFTAKEAGGGVAPPPAPEIREVVGLGKLVPRGDVIAVATPFGAGDARIAELRAAEGDLVRAGDIIAVLDSAPQYEAAIAAAKAKRDVEAAVLDQVRSATASSRDEAKASLDGALAALEIADLDYQRTEQLARKGVATRAALDQKRTARDAARTAVERARATLARFDEALVSGRMEEEVQVKRLAAAGRDLARAEQDLEKAMVRAPISGTILSLDGRAGEKPPATGIASMADLSAMTAEVEIYEASISEVKPGAAVTLSAPALAAPLSGQVERVGLEVKRQTVTDSSPAANTDARVVKVVVALDAESSARARGFTNMQVMARIGISAAP